MSERRRCPRQRVFKAGTIGINRAGAISCTVRNLSPLGACVEVAAPFGIPEWFDLTIAPENIVHHCRMVWHSANRIGVAFEQAR